MKGESGARVRGGGVWLPLLPLTALAWAALAVAGYRFGVNDQTQYLACWIEASEPGVLADDPYIVAFASLGSIFWHLVAWISTERSLAAVVLVLTMLITMGNACLLASIGGSLLRTADPGRSPAWLLVFPLLFVLPKEQNWFGLVSLGDVELTATLGVMPLVFAAMLLWIRGRTIACLLVSAAAVPIHGQVGAYLLSAWFCSALIACVRERRLVPWVVAVGCAGVAGAAAAVSFSAVPPDLLDRYEMIGMDLYAPLIDPLRAPIRPWGSVGAILLIGAASAVALGRMGFDEPSRRLLLWAGASLALPCAGLALLGLGVREPLLWKLMVGRGLMLAQIASLVLSGVWAVRVIQGAGARRLWGWIRPAWALGVLAVVTIWPFASWSASSACAVLGTLALGIALCGHESDHGTVIPGAGLIGVHVLAAGVLALGVDRFLDRTYPWLESGQDPQWLEAQRWARRNTPAGTVFVTPPYLSGWRWVTHRPSYGQLKDGGLLFYAGTPVLEWADRMLALGMDRPLTWIELDRAPARQDTTALARRYAEAIAHAAVDPSVSYVVLERDYDVEVGPIAWSNERLVIRRARGGSRSRLWKMAFGGS